MNINLKKIKILLVALIIVFSSFFIFGSTLNVQAGTIQSDFGLEQVGDQINLGEEDLRATIARIIQVVLGILGTIALVIVIYGGVVYMTAGGNEQKLATAKKILINGAIGLVIILSAFAITSFVLTRLAGATGYGTNGTTQSCADLGGCSIANPQCCGGGTFGSCTNLDDQFVVKSITPHTPAGATGMYNFAIRAVFSQGLDPSYTTVGDVFAVVERDLLDVSAEFDITFIDAERKVVELTPNGPLAGYLGDYDISVSTDLVSSGGIDLETDTICGGFPLDAGFFVDVAIIDNQAPEVLDIIDDLDANTGDITYRGLATGSRIALPQNGSYQIGANIIDDHGVGYVEMIVQRHQNDSTPIGAPHRVVYDGPSLSRGSEAVLGNPYNFIYYLIVDGTYPLRTDAVYPNSYYTITLNVHDIDNNVRTVVSEFDVVANSCSFPDGFGADPSCRGVGTCTGDSDCLSGVCDEDVGMCLAVPIINEINPWDGAEGNWVTILGNFFGETEGNVFFDGVLANTPSCGGADVWHNDYIIVEVPGVGLPEGGGIEVRVDHNLFVVDPIANPDFFDTTGNDRGPIGAFTKNNTIIRPGLCSVLSNEPTEPYNGTNAGLPGTAVIASGQNLGNVTDTITFGGIQGSVDAWADNQIDAVVPENLNRGWVGVIARVGAESSNGIPYRIMSEDELVSPLIESIDPENITRESYVTISGQRFGNTPGVLYACTDTGMLDCLILNTSLPLECGTTWTNTQIIAEVPNGFPIGSRYLVVENGLPPNLRSVPSEADRLNVIAGAPLPSICALSPVYGSAPLPDGHAGLNIIGVNFSINPTLYFWARNSEVTNNNTWLALNGAVVPAGPELQSVLTQIPVDYAGPIPPLVQSNPLINGDGFSMQSGPIKVVANLGAGPESNSVSYAVTDCRELSTIPTGMHCCSEGGAQGSLLYESIACPDVPRDGGYVWRFTTGVIPEFRRVVEECNNNDFVFSPTPLRTHNDGENVCLNRQVAVQFTGPMEEASFVGNVSLFTCGTDDLVADPQVIFDEPSGCIPVAEVSNNYTDGGADSNSILIIRDLFPAVNGFGDLLPNTWYHVELSNDINGISSDMVLGVLTDFLTPLQRTRPCSDTTAYCFDFKTGPVGTECILEDVAIKPIDYTVARLGLVLNNRYPVDSNVEIVYQIFGRGDQECSMVSVSNYEWDWSTDLPLDATVTEEFDDTKATAFVLQEPVGGTVVIHAEDVPDAEFGADSNLNIILGPPRIVDYWPNCGEACSNAGIGARFNRDVDPSLYATGIHLYRCGNSAEGGGNTCINAIADFDPDAPVAPALPELNFNVFNDTNRSVAEIIPDTALPGDLLDPDTNYLVYFDDSIRSVARVSEVTGDILALGPALEPFMWTFKTKADGTFCMADNIDVRPDPFISYFVGEKTKYSAFAFTNPDQCSSSGQRLNPWGFGWNWGTADAEVAVVSNFQSAGELKPYCGLGCLPSGSDIVSGGISTFCGNGIVEPGEDCDIAVVGEVAGDSCSINCLRPGNTNATCGNSILETNLGEECDPGLTSSTRVGCSNTCLHIGSTRDIEEASTGQPICDGSEVTVGEDCEPGLNGEVLGRTCTSNCLHIGTGLVQEWCDDRSAWQDTDECRQAVSQCGNGELEFGEECEIIGGQFHLFDGDFGVPASDNGTVIPGIFVADFDNLCSSNCLLQNICDSVIPAPFYCDPNTQEGCKPDCTLHGSSIDRYTIPSLCGDGVVGDGEYGWCEYTVAEMAGFAIPGQNPVQSVRSVGTRLLLDPGTQLMSTLIESNIVRVRGELADLIPAQQTQLSDEADYALACGFTEYEQPDLANNHNDCRGNVNNTLGVGSNSCCYDRPERVDEYPYDGAGILDPNVVCLNSLVSVTFDGNINETTLLNNVWIARGYEVAPPVDCVDITSDIDGTLAYENNNKKSDSIFINIWNTIKRFFTWATGGQAKASITNVATVGSWCRQNLFSGLPLVNKTTDVDGNVIESRVDFYLNNLLEQNAYYTVLLKGGNNGIKDVRGVGIRSPLNNVVARTGEIDDSFMFRTGDDVCKINSINVIPAGYFYDTPNTDYNFTAVVESTSGQLISPIPGVYDWEWFWTPSADTLFTIDPDIITTGNIPNRIIASTELEGSRTAGAHATVLVDTDLVDSQVGQTFTGTAELVSFFCENPWPPRDYFPFEDEVGNNDGTTAGIFDGSTMLGTSNVNGDFFNFEMSYCADSGLVGNVVDDLPYLRPFVFNIASGLPDAENLKRFLFFNSVNDDVIGLQVFLTDSAPTILEKETLTQWFRRKIGEPTGFNQISVDGYEAMTNGSNYYISAANRPGLGELYNNIFVFSINENAQQNTYDVFEQLINSLEFNSNISNDLFCENAVDISCSTDFDCRDLLGNPLGGGTGMCSADQTKMRRDWSRFITIRNAQVAMNGYVDFGSEAPQLRAGTYIPGRTRSLWPSWGNLGQEIGGGVGIDPINRWTTCNYCHVPGSLVDGVEQLCSTDVDCAGAGEVCVTVDSQTCWDEVNSRFICPAVSSVLEYRPDVANDYMIYGRPEYFGLSDLGSFIDVSHFQIGSMCGVSGSTESPLSGSCGNGIVNGTEQCDPPGQLVDTLNACAVDVNGVPISGTLARVCNSSCNWQDSGCDVDILCGNGRVDGLEQCDDGALNGTPGNCSAMCTFSASFCGDNVVNSYCAFNNVNCTGNPNACVTSCGTNRNCLAMNVCSPVEYCDIGANNGAYLTPPTFALPSNSCSANCKQLGPRCGDGILHTGNSGAICLNNSQCFSNNCSAGVCTSAEECDDGNNISGDGCANNCRNEASAPVDNVTPDLGNCGNSNIDAGEVCDRGDGINGVQCVPGYNQGCNFCSWDCREVLYIEPNAYCGNENIDVISLVDYGGSGNINDPCTVATQVADCDSNYCSPAGFCQPLGYCTANTDCNSGYCVDNFCSRTEVCEYVRPNCVGANCPNPYIVTNSGTFELDQCSRRSGNYSLENGTYTTLTGNYECRNSCGFLYNNCIQCGSKRLTSGGIDPSLRILNPMISLHYSGGQWGTDPNGLFAKFYFRDYTEPNGPYFLTNSGSSLLVNNRVQFYAGPDLVDVMYVPSNIFYPWGETDILNGIIADNACNGSYYMCLTPQAGTENCLETSPESEFVYSYDVNNELNTVVNDFIVSPALPEGQIRVVLKWTREESQEFGGTDFGLGILSADDTLGGTDRFMQRNMATPKQICIGTELVGGYWIPDYNFANTTRSCTVWPLGLGNEGFYMHDINEGEDTFIQSMTINIPLNTAPNSLLNYGPYAVFVEAQSVAGGVPMAYFDDSDLEVYVYEYRETPAGAESFRTVFRPDITYVIEDALKSSNPAARYWHLFNIDRDATSGDYEILPLNRIATSAEQIQTGGVIGELSICGDGRIDGSEICDPAIPGQNNCLNTCDGYAVCGNGSREANEECDGSSLNCGFFEECYSNCECGPLIILPPAYCGDGIIQPPGEECDGSNAGCYALETCNVDCRCVIDVVDPPYIEP